VSTPEARSDGVAAATTAAVATAAAAYLVKRALSGTGGMPTLLSDDEDTHSRSVPTMLASAPDMLLPLMDHAVEAAGKWVAENSPEVIRDRLLPRFMRAFTDAAKRRG